MMNFFAKKRKLVDDGEEKRGEREDGQKIKTTHGDKENPPICCICGEEIRLGLITFHIDECLRKASKSSSSPSSRAAVDSKTLDNKRKDQNLTKINDPKPKVATVCPSLSQPTTSIPPSSLPSTNSSTMSLSTNTSKNVNTDSLPPDLRIVPSPLNGLYVIHNFITEEEERVLIDLIEQDQGTPWCPSKFNGKYLVKNYGLRTQYWDEPDGGRKANVRHYNPQLGEEPIPSYMSFVMDRLRILYLSKGEGRYFAPVPEVRTKEAIDKFQRDMTDFLKGPDECNINKYVKKEGHWLDAHCDNRELSGPILANLSLSGESSMTYRRDKKYVPSLDQSNSVQDASCIKVRLPRRTLQLVTRDSRYYYTHEVMHEDIVDKERMSITWRYPKFLGRIDPQQRQIKSFFVQPKQSQS